MPEHPSRYLLHDYISPSRISSQQISFRRLSQAYSHKSLPYLSPLRLSPAHPRCLTRLLHAVLTHPLLSPLLPLWWTHPSAHHLFLSRSPRYGFAQPFLVLCWLLGGLFQGTEIRRLRQLAEGGLYASGIRLRSCRPLQDLISREK